MESKFIPLRHVMAHTGLDAAYLLRLAKEDKIVLYFGRALDNLENQKIDFKRRAYFKDYGDCLIIENINDNSCGYIEDANPYSYLDMERAEICEAESISYIIETNKLLAKETIDRLWISKADFERLAKSGNEAMTEKQDDSNKQATKSKTNTGYSNDALLKVIGLLMDIAIHDIRGTKQKVDQTWIVRKILDEYMPIENVRKRTVDGIMAAANKMDREAIKEAFEEIVLEGLELVQSERKERIPE